MASRKDNLKALFTNTRTRVIIVFTLLIFAAAVFVGLTKFFISSGGIKASSTVTSAPNMRSIPGTLNPTPQYANLQEIQNVNQAKSALQTGSSAIPTIIRSQSLGQGVGVIGQEKEQPGVGFTVLAREEQNGSKLNLWMNLLKKENCASTAIKKVLTQGAKIQDVKKVCNCAQLKDYGFPLTELVEVCSCTNLKSLGIGSPQFKEIGFSTEQLRVCGFNACELKNVGYNAQQMKDGGYTDGELKGAGYSAGEIKKASGLPDGIAEFDIRKAGCTEQGLKQLKASGVSASAIRRINGCSSSQLKAAGFDATDLRNAGFTAAELKNAGFTPKALKDAGYNARDLLNAGFTPSEDLVKAGFTKAQIQAAELKYPPGMTSTDVKSKGCDVTELQKQRILRLSAARIKEDAGCSAKALRAAGFDQADLANAGFTPAEIAASSPVDDEEIKKAGCDPIQLKGLLQKGVSAKRIHDLNGCSAQALKEAGFGASALLAAGFNPEDLKTLGFTPGDIIAAQLPVDCSVESLKAARAAGISAKTIRQTLGCSAKAMKEAGYTAAELRAAGYTAAELKNAGFTAAELKAAGFSAKELKDAGFTAQELKDAGFSAKELKEAGFTAAELKAAGFTASQLKAAGYSASDLKKAGFSAAELKALGFSASDLKKAGFSAKELKDAGFSAKELKDAGFNAKELKDAGFSAKELKDAEFTANELKEAGFSAADLKSAGFPFEEIRKAGYSHQALLDAGIPASEQAGLPGYETPETTSSLTGLPVSKQNAAAQAEAENAKRLQQILEKQHARMAEQRYQQNIADRANDVSAAFNDAIGNWTTVNTQVYVGGSETQEAAANNSNSFGTAAGNVLNNTNTNVPNGPQRPNTAGIVKTGDIMFAVLDTSVNSDEPGPILATIVSGKLKGSKLIGSFTLPANAEKMVISFNTLSVPGAPRTVSISAFAIDPNTARTALSTYTDHHYLLRYGSLFASSFIEGFGNAIQAADTTVTIGGSGGGDNITVQQGINRSTLQNAVIGLATLGRNWGQAVQQQFNRPSTVEVCSGTGIGVLFTQDLTSLE